MQILIFFRNTTGFLGDVSFSPNSKEIAIVITKAQGTFKFYDSSSGKLISRPTTNRLSGFNFSYSPDSQTIAFNGLSGIKLLNYKAKSDFIELPAEYEREINQTKQKGFIDLQYSADGKKIIVINKDYDKNYVDIWDWQEKEKRRINIGDSWIKVNDAIYPTPNFASITPDGKFLIIVTKESIQKTDLEGNLISEINTSVDPEEKVLHFWLAGTYTGDRHYSSSLDGNIIATSGLSLSSELRLWNLSTEQVKQFEYNYGNLHQVLVSPNGKYVLTISTDAVTKLWDTSGNLLNPLDVNAKHSSNQEEVSMLAIVPDSTVQKVFGRRQIKILDVFQNSTAMKAGLRSGDVIEEIDGREIPDNLGDVFKLLMGEPGTPVKIKFMSSERGFERQEKTILREKFVFDESNLLLFAIAGKKKFSPDSQYLAMWEGSNLFLRNIKTNKLVEINNPEQIVNVNFSPDSKFLAITNTDHPMRIWDFSGNLVNEIKLLQVPSRIAFSPDSQQIAVLDSNEFTIWTLDGRQIAKHTIPEENQGQIVFSPDGKYIATGQNKVFIWQNKHLNELLATGCDWLQEYLTTRPQEKEKLKVCQEEVK